LASQGNFPRQLSRVNPITCTPLIATAVAVSVILLLSVTVRLDGLAEWAGRGTLLVFAGVDAALIRIKRGGEQAAQGVFNCST
jgi:basic amino acid/polyamine antiporter, APA family